MAMFETEMTVGKAACPARGIAQHQAPEPEDIPYPEGDGWCLVSILPVPFNEPFLQYFWQRDIESEDEESSRPKGKKQREKDNDTVNSVELDQYSNLPYPIIVDSGAAETVLPKGWCRQAEIVKDNSGRTYSAANGSQIRNEGHKTVAMVTKQTNGAI